MQLPTPKPPFTVLLPPLHTTYEKKRFKHHTGVAGLPALLVLLCPMLPAAHLPTAIQNHVKDITETTVLSTTKCCSHVEHLPDNLQSHLTLFRLGLLK